MSDGAAGLSGELWDVDRLAERRRGTWVDPGRGQITLADWVEVWGRGQVHLRPRTRARDDAYLKARTLPALGGVPIAAVTTAMVERFRDELVADGLAPATVEKHLQILSKVFGASDEVGVRWRGRCGCCRSTAGGSAV